MKKLISLLATFVLIISLQGCTSDSNEDSGKKIADAECNCSLTVPENWELGTDYENASIEVISDSGQEQVLIYHIDIPEGQQIPFDQYVAKTLEQVSETIGYELLSERKVTIGGLPGVQYELVTSAGGQPLTNLLTIMQGELKYYQILGWSVTAVYQTVLKSLHSVTDSFQPTL